MTRAILRSLSVAALVFAGAFADRSLEFFFHCPRDQRRHFPPQLLLRYGIARPGERIVSCLQTHRAPDVLPLFSHIDHICYCAPPGDAVGAGCTLDEQACPQARCDERLDR